MVSSIAQLELIKAKKNVWCNPLYLSHKQINSHKSRFNLFVLLTEEEFVLACQNMMCIRKEDTLVTYVQA